MKKKSTLLRNKNIKIMYSYELINFICFKLDRENHEQ